MFKTGPAASRCGSDDADWRSWRVSTGSRFANLVPLLFVLACAVMMLKCMKGTNRGPQTGTTQAAAPSDTLTAIDMRN